jgi:hypothetical protein
MALHVAIQAYVIITLSFECVQPDRENVHDIIIVHSGQATLNFQIRSDGIQIIGIQSSPCYCNNVLRTLVVHIQVVSIDE